MALWSNGHLKRETRVILKNRRSGRSTRHQQISDAIWRALKRADVPSRKEPAGISGVLESVRTVKPGAMAKWRRRLTWDVTVVDTLASSYTPMTSVTPCGAAEAAATRS